MKKSLVLTLVLLSILTFIISIAATQPISKTAMLWGVQYNDKGLNLKFTVAGFDKRSDLRGSIIVDKHIIPLQCKFDDIKTVKCVAKGMNRYDGLAAKVWFAGHVFYTPLPFLSDGK